MSRDFVIEFKDEYDCKVAEEILKEVYIENYEDTVFSVDNRGNSIFATLVWPHDISGEMNLVARSKIIPNFRDQVDFVALKNGHHNSEGYVVDTENVILSQRVRLNSIFDEVLKHFNVKELQYS